MAKTAAKVNKAITRSTSVGGQAETRQEIAVFSEQRNDDAIAVLAYEFWIQRGCPIGSPEEDWFRAEEELKNGKVLTLIAGGGK